MHLLLTSTAAFLELAQTKSEKFSVLLRWQVRYRILRAARMGQILSSGCLTWVMVSLLPRFHVLAIETGRIWCRKSGVTTTMIGKFHASRSPEMLLRGKWALLAGRMHLRGIISCQSRFVTTHKGESWRRYIAYSNRSVLCLGFLGAFYRIFENVQCHFDSEGFYVVQHWFLVFDLKEDVFDALSILATMS